MKLYSMQWVFLTLLLANSSLAKSPIDPLVDEALQNNPALLATRQEWEAQRAMVSQASSLPDPMIGADFERFESTSFSDYHDIEYMILQPLPGFGQLRSGKAAARLEAEAGGFRYLEAARTLRSDVTKAWWDLWEKTKSIEVMRKNTDLLEQMEKSVRARYESGSAPQGDLLRIQIELDNMKNDYVTMQREETVSQSGLNALLNVPQETKTSITSTPPLPNLDSTTEELQADSLKYSCNLLSLLRSKDAKESALKVAKSQGRPNVELRVEARQFEGDNNIDEYDTGIFLNIPWLWRGKYSGMIRGAKANLDKANAEFDSEVNNTMVEIRDLHTMADSALRRVHLYDETLVPRARQLVETTSSSYQSGQSTYLEYLDAQDTLLKLELEAIRARAEYARKHAELQNIAAPWGDYEISTGLVTADMNMEEQ